MTTCRKPRGRMRYPLRAASVAIVAMFAIGAFLPAAVSADVPTAGPSTVFFPATGHNMNGDFLDFWHKNGGADRIGNPITEEIKDSARAKQYFERGTVEYTPGLGIAFGRLGAEFIQGRYDPAFMPRTRDEYGSDRDNRRFFAPTGHGIDGLFATFWSQNGDLGIFGFPLSEPTREVIGEKKEPMTVQYFERARFGREYAALRALGVNPVPKSAEAIEYSASIWPKWIDVNLKTQHLVAYEGDAVAQQFDITSGTAKNPTPAGVFQLFAKVKSERMRGDIGLPTQYDIKNVPWTMYFAGGGYAIHGAPWRNVYGPGTDQDGSHGCVNSPVSQADVLYQWAPLGTTVIIHF